MSKNGLDINQVSVRLRSGQTILDRVSLRCDRGKITAIIGPNGAGKSSLIRALLGILPRTGQVMLDGKDVAVFSPLDRAKKLAYVPQKTSVEADLLVWEVVDQGRFPHRNPMVGPTSADREVTERSLQTVGMGEFYGRRFIQLSYGQQQRVLLARALATESTTLLLDEPTAALDVRQALLIHRHLHELKTKNYCVVIVLHNLNEVKRVADQVAILDGGRVKYAGAVEEVISQEPIEDVYGVRLMERGGLDFSLLDECNSRKGLI